MLEFDVIVSTMFTMRLPVIALTLLSISCSHGEISHHVASESLTADQESRLRGSPPAFDEAMDTQSERRDLSSSTLKEESTVREGRSHVNEAEPGDDLGKYEELLDSDGLTSDDKKTPTTSKKATSTGTKKAAPTSTNKVATSRTKNDSTSTKKLSSTAGEGTSRVSSSTSEAPAETKSSAGVENEADNTEDNKNKSKEMETEESTKKEPKISSYSSGVYAPSICGKSRSEVEAVCNTDLPICKFQTKQASGHEPFRITTDLRAGQGDCIRRCDSKWGLSDQHCAQDEECHEGVVACTKCSLLNKRGCEAF